MHLATSNILAVVYSDGLAADKFLADWGYRLRDAGLTIAGLVQLNSFVRDPQTCDMDIEELYSGAVVRLSEDRGKEARGCRLDRAKLATADALLAKALCEPLDLLILNKFGKTEAEGGGLRDVLARAVVSGLPLIVGVPFRNLDQWRSFAGELAQECQISEVAVERWLRSHRLLPKNVVRHDESVSDAMTARG